MLYTPSVFCTVIKSNRISRAAFAAAAKPKNSLGLLNSQPFRKCLCVLAVLIGSWKHVQNGFADMNIVKLELNRSYIYIVFHAQSMSHSTRISHKCVCMHWLCRTWNVIESLTALLPFSFITPSVEEHEEPHVDGVCLCIADVDKKTLACSGLKSKNDDRSERGHEPAIFHHEQNVA